MMVVISLIACRITQDSDKFVITNNAHLEAEPSKGLFAKFITFVHLDNTVVDSAIPFNSSSARRATASRRRFVRILQLMPNSRIARHQSIPLPDIYSGYPDVQEKRMISVQKAMIWRLALKFRNLQLQHIYTEEPSTFNVNHVNV
ncbi:hypothetical protein NEOLI_004134 [Neolecta irregularis DAH-3]|uniref:Uncharacterized protein n=1 Tax=Neolecta irregularis (strain DAH-3) TaxID=1198029 RepID=A0A1U7LKM2_NEOID|nr:hypothetical protein NEOLI_004134 [Neolecta irregularis DAH-3]|eukprot:OLL23071.1 hypothetical protein NEOLI_004134 [Neolecta irregularis DAH-3]